MRFVVFGKPRRPALRVLSVVASGLGGFALALTLAGLYGVLSHIVTRRARELGVRLALGAETRQILLLVLRDGLMPVLAGVVLGIPARILAHDALDGYWAVEPLLFGGVAIALVLCGAAACYRPARCASRVDPNVVLKAL